MLLPAVHHRNAINYLKLPGGLHEHCLHEELGDHNLLTKHCRSHQHKALICMPITLKPEKISGFFGKKPELTMLPLPLFPQIITSPSPTCHGRFAVLYLNFWIAVNVPYQNDTAGELRWRPARAQGAGAVAHISGDAGDVADCVMRAAVRLNLAISQLPEVVAAHDYDLQEPRESSASWVEELCGHAGLLKDRLDQVAGLDHATNTQATPPPPQHLCSCDPSLRTLNPEPLDTGDAN